jgi:AbrB family looped-hinge helix DNA binding protein
MTGMRITLRAKGQLTLPEAIRKAANLAEGDLLEAEVAEDGTVILRPVTTVDRSQAWFWQADHQAGEREASEQGVRDEGESFGSGQEFLASLQ